MISGKDSYVSVAYGSQEQQILADYCFDYRCVCTKKPPDALQMWNPTLSVLRNSLCMKTYLVWVMSHNI